MAMTCLAECPTKMAKQGCEDASLTDRPGREEVGTAGKEAAATAEDEDVVVGGGGQRWLFGEIWRTQSSFPPTSSPGCGLEKEGWEEWKGKKDDGQRDEDDGNPPPQTETLQEMEKQLEADRKQRSIRQRAAKRGAQTGKDEKKKSSEGERVKKETKQASRGGGKTGGESTDDLVRTDGHESSIARPVEMLQLDEFMSQSRRRLEPWICLSDGKLTVGFCFIEWSSVGTPEMRGWTPRIITARTRRYEPRIRNPALSNRQSRRRAQDGLAARAPSKGLNIFENPNPIPIRGPSWTVHKTEEARPRDGEAPGTAASGAPQREGIDRLLFPGADQKSSADGPRAATRGDVNHSMLPRPFVWKRRPEPNVAV
ncbi:uncharacterized protein An16g03480 [Aspergillus niger]|uniref:Contig An16c0130, genomic contig n=2 Tax=Aspergillus niger TaxID=5061 RepID=A2R7G8_ASPNC|nr:uncharacterized protein An16g03480 [Aspergillus niger]CAK42846.1 unnamed protein product [Aspergillus niger]